MMDEYSHEVSVFNSCRVAVENKLLNLLGPISEGAAVTKSVADSAADACWAVVSAFPVSAQGPVIVRLLDRLPNNREEDKPSNG